MLKPGDVILAPVQFVDQTGVKVRPAVVLYEEFGNIVAAGITSNPALKGIPVTRKEGAYKDGVIKLNYLFTLIPPLIQKKLFVLSSEKKRLVYEGLKSRLSSLAE